MATPAKGGSMNNPGTKNKPFAQLKQFSDIARPGDTLLLRGGLYTDSWGTTMTRSGSKEGGTITYRNFPGEVPILDGCNDAKSRQSVCFYSFDDHPLSYVRIQGLVLRRWVRTGIGIGANYKDLSSTNDHIDIRDNVVDECGQNGITLMFGHDDTVQNNLVSRTGYDPSMGSWSSNINLYKMTGGNNLVDGNVAFEGIDISDHHTDGNGLILDLSSKDGLNGGITATNNVFFWNGGAGIALTTSGNATFENNTLWENGQEPTSINKGVGFVSWDASDGFVLKNNIAVQSKGVGIKLDHAYPKAVVSNNLASGEAKFAAPKFVNAQDGDFRLHPTSSGVDAGAASGAPIRSIGLDPKVIKVQTSDQPVKWFKYAPDLEYITQKGGLEKCFALVQRPQGRGVDLGAYEQ